MATIRHKRSTTAGATPSASAFVEGELAVNVADGRVFVKRSNGTVSSVTSDGHGHAIGDVSGLQNALDGKAASSHTHALSSITGVAISSPSSGQVLKFNGTNWVNDTDATGGGGSVTAEDDQIILAMRVFA